MSVLQFLCLEMMRAEGHDGDSRGLFGEDRARWGGNAARHRKKNEIAVGMVVARLSVE
jgi:hypothetical protein